MNRRILFLILLLLQVSVCSLSAITKKDVLSLIEGQHYAQAVTALQTLMQQPANARDAEYNKLMGQSLCMTGRYEESVPYLEFAIKQNKKSGALWYLAISLQHLYDFEGALDALDTYRPVLSSDFWISRADSLENMIQQGLRAMEHVQDVVVIDSLYVPRSSFFSNYQLGVESGRVLHDDDLGLFFENQAADYRIYSVDNKLYQCHRIQGEWEELDLLPGLGSETFRVIDPFMRSDGETLYFATDSIPGIGGLDIYRTKYNAEEGVYYQPERLGMPFNSPYDDYMLAIDETHQVGWWATNRNCDAEHVMIYLFLLEDDPEYLDEATPAEARLDNIASTWREQGGYADLIASLKEPVLNDASVPQIRIIINDQKEYSHEDQFASAAARAAYNESIELEKQLESANETLATLREEYINADKTRRKQLASQIIRLEEQVFSVQSQYRSKVKMYRSLEQ